jgi:hypothetical protein
MSLIDLETELIMTMATSWGRHCCLTSLIVMHQLLYLLLLLSYQ